MMGLINRGLSSTSPKSVSMPQIAPRIAGSTPNRFPILSNSAAFSDIAFLPRVIRRSFTRVSMYSHIGVVNSGWVSTKFLMVGSAVSPAVAVR